MSDMINIPNKIFLVFGEDSEELKESDFNQIDHEFVCWCPDRNFDTDIEYVLKSSIESRIKKVFEGLNDKYPYKKRGDAETYSKYNEGASDALDIAEQEVLQCLKETT